MSENPLHLLSQAFSVVSECIQSHFSQLISRPSESFSHSPSPKQKPFQSSTAQPQHFAYSRRPADIIETTTGPTTKEELGRATWLFLHTLAAQYPDKPTKQQKKDVKELMSILSRMYPCKECADHFKDVLRANPVQAGSHDELSQWMCHVHNVVNRSLGKVIFQCERVDARWGKLECENRGCDLQGSSMSFGSEP